MSSGITLEESGSNVLFAGPALSIQRLRAEVAKIVGVGAILITGRNSFSIPRELLPAVGGVFDDKVRLPQFARSVIDAAVSHQALRKQVMRILENNDVGDLPDNWLSVLEPMQAVAANAMVVPGLPGFCLFDEQGSGKTVMVIAAIDVLLSRGEVNYVIVVCPKTMCAEWSDSFNRFCHDRHAICVLDGEAHDRTSALLKPADVVVLSFEQLAAHQALLSAIAEGRNTLLVADESYYVKNATAKRSVAARALRRACKRGIVLCGTPAPNSPEDIVNQFTVADNGYTFPAFVPTGQIDIDTATINDCIGRRGIFVRRLKEDILEHVPEKAFKVHRISLSGRQREMYDRAARDLLLELRTLDNRLFKKRLAHYFQQRNVLLRICSCPSAVDPLFHENDAKLTALKVLADEILTDPTRKLVVWSFYTKGVDNACKALSQYGLVRVDGLSPSAEERSRSVFSFQNDPGVRVFVGNPAAAGAGITLHAAADAIYLSFPTQAAHYLQSIDRIHRRGQIANKTTAHLLVCEGTIEKTEVARLRSKELRQAELLGDKIPWPADLDEAIAELLPDHHE